MELMLRRIHLCAHDTLDTRIDKSVELFLAVDEAVEGGDQVGLVIEFAAGTSRGDILTALSRMSRTAGVTAIRVGSLVTPEAARSPRPAE